MRFGWRQKKRLCDSSAEEENILGNVALSPPAAYHLPLETHFSDLHVETKYILKCMRSGPLAGRALHSQECFLPPLTSHRVLFFVSNQISYISKYILILREG